MPFKRKNKAQTSAGESEIEALKSRIKITRNAILANTKTKEHLDELHSAMLARLHGTEE